MRIEKDNTRGSCKIETQIEKIEEFIYSFINR